MPYFYLVFLVMFLHCAKVTAQTSPDSPQKALNAVFEKGNLMAALSGHEWRPGLNLAAAYLPVGQTISLNVTLLKGIDYVFLASGPTELTDVDLYVRDLAGKVLAEDLQEDGTPVVEFRPAASGTFQLQLHLAAGTSAEMYVALCLLRRGGRQVTEKEYRNTAAGFFMAAKKTTLPPVGMQWQKQAGAWCLFGYSLQEKDGVSLRNIRPTSGQNIFAVAGPASAKITLHLANQTGTIVAQTTEPQTFPLLRYTSPPNTTLDLRIGVERSKSHFLALLGVLHE